MRQRLRLLEDEEMNITEAEAYEQYDDFLDELGLESLNLPPASEVLKEVDPTQYDCGFADFCDAEDFEIEED